MTEVGSEHRNERAVTTTADRLHDVLSRLFGQPVPLRLRAWDGSESGPADAPLVTVRSRRALRRLLWRPDELGLARAYIAEEMDIDGSLVDLLEQLDGFDRSADRRQEAADRGELLRTAVLLGAVGPQPKRPAEETGGPLPHLEPEVARAIFGDSYACTLGDWSSASDLEAAETAGIDRLIDRLALEPGSRVLDIGAGWGAFLVRAGERLDITGRGCTADDRQAAVATARLGAAGLGEAIEVEAGDWTELDEEPFDAIVGSAVLGSHGVACPQPSEVAAMRQLLRPGGRADLQVIGRRRPPFDRGFRAAYLDSDVRLPRPGDVFTAVEAADLEVLGVETIRADLARTVRAWAANLEAADVQEPAAVRLWHLVLAELVTALDTRSLGAYRLLAMRPAA